MSIIGYKQSEILNRLRLADREEQLARQAAQRDAANISAGLSALNTVVGAGFSAADLLAQQGMAENAQNLDIAMKMGEVQDYLDEEDRLAANALRQNSRFSAPAAVAETSAAPGSAPRVGSKLDPKGLLKNGHFSIYPDAQPVELPIDSAPYEATIAPFKPSANVSPGKLNFDSSAGMGAFNALSGQRTQAAAPVADPIIVEEQITAQPVPVDKLSPEFKKAEARILSLAEKIQPKGVADRTREFTPAEKEIVKQLQKADAAMKAGDYAGAHKLMQSAEAMHSTQGGQSAQQTEEPRPISPRFDDPQSPIPGMSMEEFASMEAFYDPLLDKSLQWAALTRSGVNGKKAEQFLTYKYDKKANRSVEQPAAFKPPIATSFSDEAMRRLGIKLSDGTIPMPNKPRQNIQSNKQEALNKDLLMFEAEQRNLRNLNQNDNYTRKPGALEPFDDSSRFHNTSYKTVAANSAAAPAAPVTPPAPAPIFPQDAKGLAAQQAAELAAANATNGAPSGLENSTPTQTSAFNAEQQKALNAVKTKIAENSQVIQKYAQGIGFQSPQYEKTSREQGKAIVAELEAQRNLRRGGAAQQYTGPLGIIVNLLNRGQAEKDDRFRETAEKLAARAVAQSRQKNRAIGLEEAIQRAKFSEQFNSKGGSGGQSSDAIKRLKENRALENDEIIGLVTQKYGPEVAEISKITDPEARAIATQKLFNRIGPELPVMEFTTPGIVQAQLQNDIAEYGEEWRNGISDRLTNTKSGGKSSAAPKLVPAAEIAKLSALESAATNLSFATPSQNPEINRILNFAPDKIAAEFKRWLGTSNGKAQDAAIRRNVANYLKSISGAAATDAEYARIYEMAPNDQDDIVTYYRKLNDMVAEINRLYATSVSNLEAYGYYVPSVVRRTLTNNDKIKKSVDESNSNADANKKTNDVLSETQ